MFSLCLHRKAVHASAVTCMYMHIHACHRACAGISDVIASVCILVGSCVPSGSAIHI